MGLRAALARPHSHGLNGRPGPPSLAWAKGPTGSALTRMGLRAALARPHSHGLSGRPGPHSLAWA
ncbi:predicted protein [Nematostella vectensis]|uniref:Uncharacterized protein n=1 Tax=Nematostella vectensis TaxID=45351 RepID=A7RPM9_NEMVE|nr:predicted protein [Nematostella vectensis]|eukprot:XP_001638663.1 predicted protein [Nematostella vectensis]